MVLLLAELIAELAATPPADVAGNAPLLPKVTSIQHLKADLGAAGISYKDELGRQADFHSLRVTYRTLSAQWGVDTCMAMELMRRSDIRLTTQLACRSACRYSVHCLAQASHRLAPNRRRTNNPPKRLPPRKCHQLATLHIKGKAPVTHQATRTAEAGELGFEPRLSGPEPLVLPLHHSPDCLQVYGPSAGFQVTASR